MRRSQLKVAIGAIVKNEADYLLEWIAYHWVVGIRHFLIASNDSTDQTNQILLKLQKLGLVTFIDYPTHGDTKPQVPAYNKLVTICPKDIDLLAFIDADEYLTPVDGTNSILPFLEDVFSNSKVSAMAVQWICFGSGGQLFREDGMVIERFIRQSSRKFSANKNYKTIVRPRAVKAFCNPHYVSVKSGYYVNTLGEDIEPLSKKRGVCEKPIWDHLRINHYVVKSLEEFVLGKSRKGSAATKGRVKHKQYFMNHDRNDEAWQYPVALLTEVSLVLQTLETLMTRLTTVRNKKTWFSRSRLSKKQAKEKAYLTECGAFDKVWYLMQYPDVADSGMDPVEHFICFGVHEKRNPAEFFDLEFYMSRYQDVASSSMNPFIHYIKFGRDEGREPFDAQ